MNDAQGTEPSWLYDAAIDVVKRAHGERLAAFGDVVHKNGAEIIGFVVASEGKIYHVSIVAFGEVTGPTPSSSSH